MLNIIQEQFSDEINLNSLKLKKLNKNTILYSGSGQEHGMDLNPFKMKGQRQANTKEGLIMFFTNHEDTAESYARCFSKDKSYINKYKVFRELNLIDLNYDENQMYMEVEDVAKVCLSITENKNNNFDGIYIEYPSQFNGIKIFEIALCNPSKNLEHIGYKKCIGPSKFDSEFIKPY